METLFEQGGKLIGLKRSNRFRGLYTQIDWDCPLIEINGVRGVGKTTLMLQRAKELQANNHQEVMYASLDDPYFYNNSLLDTAETFVKYGGLYFFLDEVHKYPPKHPGADWSAELKVIYDRYPMLKVVYSGSSVLQLYRGHGDLSRRKCSYNLQGLSFREYLNWYHDQNFKPFTLHDLLSNHQLYANEIVNSVKVIPLFRSYLQHGYFPCYHEAPSHFYRRLKDTITVILEQDIPSVTTFSNESSIKLKKLLAVLSETVPFTPNLTNLRSELYIADQRTLLNYIQALELAELITTISRDAKGIKKLHKPEKIYLNNTNLLYCLLQDKPNIGTLRETFFLNQLKSIHQVNYVDEGDFLVDSKFTFEVGGKNKTNKQVKEVHDAYLAVDDIEIGFGNRIPIWLFGFLY
jgi:predicted AAA+ superfamily ATPase